MNEPETSPERPLNAKQRAFVMHYVATHNATQSAKNAGYSPTSAHATGYDLLRHPYVKAAIEEREADLANQLGITKQTILTRLNETVERAMQAVPVLDAEGQPTGEWTYDRAGAQKGLELLGKHLGLFTERQEVRHTGTIYTLDLGSELKPPHEHDD